MNKLESLHLYPCIRSTGLRNILNESKTYQKMYAVVLANFTKYEEQLSNKL